MFHTQVRMAAAIRISLKWILEFAETISNSQKFCK